VEAEKELDVLEAHPMCPEKALAQLLAREKAAAAHAIRN
jgi:hypothetical protein